MTASSHDHLMELAQEWDRLSGDERASRALRVRPCYRPGYARPDGTPFTITDVRATTHLQDYEAYRAGGPSGFSGHGTAVVDSAMGEVLAQEAFRVTALADQERIELERAAAGARERGLS